LAVTVFAVGDGLLAAIDGSRPDCENSAATASSAAEIAIRFIADLP
jgi:hypothetical protein